MVSRVILNLQLVCANTQGIPANNKIKLWIKKIFFSSKKKIELTIRIVDIQEMLYLNWYYLGKKYPTNVLSFPFEPPSEIQTSLLGDIIICKQIIEYENRKNNIFSDVHWAHMIIHGSLHLLGYDHMCDEDAELMNAMELNIIRTLGYKTCCFL